MHERELADCIKTLVEELKRTTRTAQELTATVADAIRREREAGLPFLSRPSESGQTTASRQKR